MTAGPYAALVAAHGLSPAQRLVLEAVPRGARVLDVGCATPSAVARLAELAHIGRHGAHRGLCVLQVVREQRRAGDVLARAGELGGRVLMPVHDRPPFRSAVVADPEGAAFSLSQLVA